MRFLWVMQEERNETTRTGRLTGRNGYSTVTET